LNREKFNEILDFAVEREREAVHFYQELQEMVQFKEQKSLLKEFENIERSHIVMIENIRNNVIKNVEAPLPDIENLAISDYLVDVKPSEDMTYQDILIVAMKREEKAQKLYSDLADKTASSETRKLFLKLASEESKHKLYFEKLYDEMVLTEN